MANKIKLKRGLSTNVSNLQLETGELAVTTDTGELYVGDKDKKVLKINENTTYALTKSGSTITLKGSDGSTQTVSDSNTTYSAATQSANGLMSSTDKTKLDGIATGANNYSLPTASSSTLGGVKVGTNLSISSGVLSATDTKYDAATQSAAGLMSATDKTKLDGIATGANKITVDTALSSSSTNPVQNKVINAALANKANASTTVSTSNVVTSFDIEDAFDDNKIYNANAILEFANIVGTELTENYAAKSDIPTKTSQLTNDSGFKTTDNNTTYSISKSGSTITLTGSDGKTSTVTDSNTTYSAATTSAAGLMSANDKTKLNGIATGATANTASSTSPKAAGTAAVGSEANYARGDHVHPAQTTVSGNAGTATKFASAQSVALTGDVTGSASSQAGWSVATTLANSGVTAGSYGPTANVTGSDGATINVPQITVDAKGRVTSVTNRTYTSKDSNTTYSAATTSANGLMSSSDKTKLNGIATGAQVNNVVVSTSQPSTGDVWINPNATSALTDVQNLVNTLQTQIQTMQSTITKLSRKDFLYIWHVSDNGDNHSHNFASGDGNKINWNKSYSVGGGIYASDTKGTLVVGRSDIKTVKISATYEWVNSNLCQMKITHKRDNVVQRVLYACLESGSNSMNHLSIPTGCFTDCQKGDIFDVHFYSSAAKNSTTIRDRRYVFAEVAEYYD